MTALRAVAPAAGLTLMAIAAVLYFSDHNLYLRLLSIYGFQPYKYPFLDWESMSSFVECWKHGINVYVYNPCDVGGRILTYSPLWPRAWFIPYGPVWRNIIGLAMDIAFFLSLVWVLKPANWREALVGVLATTSTMVAYAVERANVDVIVFMMIVGAGLLASRRFAGRILSYSVIFFAGLLKVYPFVAMAIALRERPRTFALISLISAAVLIGFVVGFRSEIAELSRNVPRGNWASDSFGASNLPDGLAAVLARGKAVDPWRSPVWVGSRVLLTACALAWAVWLSRNAALARAMARLGAPDMIQFVFGSALVAGCFFAGENFEYRGVFLLPVVGGLLILRRQTDEDASRGRLGWLIAIIIALMWEGVYRTVLYAISPGLWGGVLLIREGLWWWLAASLLALLLIFAAQSDTGVAARQRFGAAHEA